MNVPQHNRGIYDKPIANITLNVKLFLFADGILLLIENIKDSTKTILRTNEEIQ